MEENDQKDATAIGIKKTPIDANECLSALSKSYKDHNANKAMMTSSKYQYSITKNLIKILKKSQENKSRLKKALIKIYK